MEQINNWTVASSVDTWGRASKSCLGKGGSSHCRSWKILHWTDQEIRDATRKELDSPPDPPSKTSGKTSDAATFVTDLLQKYDVKEYIGTVQSDESSITKKRSDNINIYSLFSSGSDV